ncbi:VOC family protein [Arcanobacterium haemolyticum]|nr:VOC family protein [Arcanobacterium haemolyticum]
MMTTDLLPSTTRMGTVLLDVRNLATMVDFYHRIVGLDILSDTNGRAELGRAATRETIVVLHEDPSLPLRSVRSAGLFHTAILFDDASDLAAALVRIAQNVPELYTGSGDHYVSQAFYLDDPEGNGVELYIDRPRETWTWEGNHVVMGTEYIDLGKFVQNNLASARNRDSESQGNSTTLGHVHLQVGDVPSARKFYVETLGFEETAVLGNSALFVSAGKYHHHMAMNTWNSAGAGMRAPALGLGRVDIVVPKRVDVEFAADRLRTAGCAVADDGAAITSQDPWGNTILIRA